MRLSKRETEQEICSARERETEQERERLSRRDAELEKDKTGREKEKEQEIIRKFVSAICYKILTTWHSVQSSRRCMLNKRGILSSSGFRFFSTHQGGQEGQTLFFQLRPKMCQAKGGE